MKNTTNLILLLQIFNGGVDATWDREDPFVHQDQCALNANNPDSCDETWTGNGADYRGCVDHTRQGLECQRWDSQTPNNHDQTPSLQPNFDLVDNHCRNPDGAADKWCYIASDAAKRWDYCNSAGCQCGWLKLAIADQEFTYSSDTETVAAYAFNSSPTTDCALTACSLITSTNGVIDNYAGNELVLNLLEASVTVDRAPAADVNQDFMLSCCSSPASQCVYSLPFNVKLQSLASHCAGSITAKSIPVAPTALTTAGGTVSATTIVVPFSSSGDMDFGLIADMFFDIGKDDCPVVECQKLSTDTQNTALAETDEPQLVDSTKLTMKRDEADGFSIKIVIGCSPVTTDGSLPNSNYVLVQELTFIQNQSEDACIAATQPTANSPVSAAVTSAGGTLAADSITIPYKDSATKLNLGLVQDVFFTLGRDTCPMVQCVKFESNVEHDASASPEITDLEMTMEQNIEAGYEVTLDIACAVKTQSDTSSTNDKWIKKTVTFKQTPYSNDVDDGALTVDDGALTLRAAAAATSALAIGLMI